MRPEVPRNRPGKCAGKRANLTPSPCRLMSQMGRRVTQHASAPVNQPSAGNGARRRITNEESEIRAPRALAPFESHNR
eukprot:3415405-Prymnesium_polylepis.1